MAAKSDDDDAASQRNCREASANPTEKADATRRSR